MAKRKYLLSLFFAAVLLLSMSAGMAEEGSVLTLPQGMKSIGAEAFYGVQSIDEIVLPESIEEIGSKAFADSSITAINLPASITSIAEDAFIGCKEFEVTAQAGSYAYNWAVDQGLIQGAEATPVSSFQYEINYETLLKYVLITGFIGDETEVILPAEIEGLPVRCIGGYAFSGCSDLTSIKIPNSVTKIGHNAFNGCSSLTSINIPDSVTSIGEDAFYGCSNLTKVYAESVEGWLGVSMYYAESNPLCYGGNLYIGDELATNITVPNTVTRINEYAFYGCGSLTSISVPDSVTRINEYAFYGCSNLTSISIPDSVTSIGEDAFYGCSSLTKVYAESVEGWLGISFYYAGSNPLCNKGDLYIDGKLATDITVPNTVTSIDKYAFYGCKSLMSISIPDSVMSIDYNAFYDCSGLMSISISDSVTDIDGMAFNGCSNLEKVYAESIEGWLSISFHYASGNPLSYGGRLYIGEESAADIVVPNTVTTIGQYAFYGCSNLSSVSIPDSVMSINGYAFYGCNNLTAIDLPKSLTTIGNYAFAECSSLKSLTIPDAVSNIGNNIIYRNKSLEYLEIGGGIENVSYSVFRISAFRDEENMLKTLVLGEGITTISDNAFSYVSHGNGDYPKLENVELPSTLTMIGKGAFSNCISLNGITITGNVTSIGDSAFNGCSALTDMVIPEGVVTIGKSAFEGCSQLRRIDLPESLTTIGKYAFKECSSLESLVIPDAVVSIGTSIIYGNSSLEYLEIGGGIENVTSGIIGSCGKLKTLVLRDGVKTIGNGVFKFRKNLETVEWPSTLMTIGDDAFANCSSLKELNLMDTQLMTIGDGAFFSCNNLTALNLPDTLTMIGDSAFRQCYSISNHLELPEGLLTLGSKAFYLCENIYGKIVIPRGVTVISDNLFKGCIDLTMLILPEGITSIADAAFPTDGDLTIYALANSYAHEWLEANWKGEYKVYTRESTYYGNKSVGTEDENIQATWEVINKYKTSEHHQFDTYLEYDNEYLPYLFELFVQEYQDDIVLQASVATSEIVNAVKNGVSDVVALAFGDIDTDSLWALMDEDKKVAQAIVDYLVTANVNVPATPTMRGVLTSDGGQFFRKWLGKWMGMGVDTPEEMEETWKKAWEELHDTIEKLEAKEAILSAEEIEIVSIMKNAKFRDYSDEALAEVVSKIRFTEKSTGKIYTFGDMLDINAGNAKSISKKITQYDNELLKGKDSITFNIDSNWDTNVKWSFRTDVEKTLYPSNEKTVFDYIEDKRGEVEAKAKELENKYPDKADKWSTALEGVLFSKWIFDAVLEGMDAYKQVAEYEAVLAVHEKELRSILNNTNCENIEAVVDEVLSILREGTANSLIYAIMESEEKLIADFASDAIGDAVVDALTKVLPKANIYTIIFDFGTDVAMLLCDASNTKLKVWGVEYLYADYQAVKQNLMDAIDTFYVSPTSETYNQLYYTAKYYALIVRSSSNQVSIILKSDAESFTGWVQSFFDKIPVEDRVEDAKEIPIKDDLKLIFFLDMLFPTAEPI